jgi:hypothetical protein
MAVDPFDGYGDEVEGQDEERQSRGSIEGDRIAFAKTPGG